MAELSHYGLNTESYSYDSAYLEKKPSISRLGSQVTVHITGVDRGANCHPKRSNNRVICGLIINDNLKFLILGKGEDEGLFGIMSEMILILC